MAMIDTMLGRLVTRGSLTLIAPDGTAATHGPGGGPALTVRYTDRKLLLDLARNPRLALGEAYMDGRLIVEDGTILDLMRLIVGANRWEDKGRGRAALNRGKSRWKALFRRNPAARSRTNVAHHYDIGNDLYRLFLDDDLQYSCAYFTDPANSLEQAQADKKAHIAAKLHLSPGQSVLDIGCGWGGTALYLHRVAGVRVHGITLSEEQLKVARARAIEAGVADMVTFELIDYRSVDRRFDRAGAADRQRRRNAAAALRLYAQPLARPHHRRARGDRRDVRRTLFPHVGILSCRRSGRVRKRHDVQLSGAICARSHRAADHP